MFVPWVSFTLTAFLYKKVLISIFKSDQHYSFLMVPRTRIELARLTKVARF